MSVPTSSATVAIDTFITELSRIIRNCAAHSVMRTAPDAFAAAEALGAAKGLGDLRDGGCLLLVGAATLRLRDEVGETEDQLPVRVAFVRGLLREQVDRVPQRRERLPLQLLR